MFHYGAKVRGDTKLAVTGDWVVHRDDAMKVCIGFYCEVVREVVAGDDC